MSKLFLRLDNKQLWKEEFLLSGVCVSVLCCYFVVEMTHWRSSHSAVCVLTDYQEEVLACCYRICAHLIWMMVCLQCMYSTWVSACKFLHAFSIWTRRKGRIFRLKLMLQPMLSKYMTTATQFWTEGQWFCSLDHNNAARGTFVLRSKVNIMGFLAPKGSYWRWINQRCFSFQEKKRRERPSTEFPSMHNLPGPKFIEKTTSTLNSLHFPGDVSVFLLLCNTWSRITASQVVMQIERGLKVMHRLSCVL